MTLSVLPRDDGAKKGDESHGFECVGPEPVYTNRKSLVDQRRELGAQIRSLVSTLPQETSIRLFDFNLAPNAEQLVGVPVVNLIPPNTGITSPDLNWAMRGNAEVIPELDTLYSSFVANAKDARIIHIDHHYDIPAVGLSSTTPLVLGLVQWCHRTGNQAFLSKLATGLAFFDHSDADILLSQYIASRSLDRPFLDQYGALLAKVAVLNDHLIVPSDPVEREVVAILYGIVQGLEHAIAAHTLTPRRAFELIEPAALFANSCAAVPGVTLQSLIDIHARQGEAPVEDPYELFDLCIRGAGRAQYERELIAGLPKLDLSSASDVAAVKQGITRVGATVFVTLTEASRDISGSQVVLSLLTDHGNFMEGAKVVVTTYPADAGFFMKFRSVISPDGAFFDLNRVYRRIRDEAPQPIGKAANGRATAGGMGKSAITGAPDEYLAAVAPILVSEISTASE